MNPTLSNEDRNKLALITEGLCPVCLNTLAPINQGLWQCINPACQMLIGLCKEKEGIDKWGCLDCGEAQWEVALEEEDKVTCHKCGGGCVRITEPN